MEVKWISKPKLVQTLKLMMSHVHQETLKTFIAYLMRIYGNNRAGSQANPIMAWGGRKKEGSLWLWILFWLGAGPIVRFSMHEPGLSCPIIFRVVVTNYYKPGGINTRHFFLYISGS